MRVTTVFKNGPNRVFFTQQLEVGSGGPRALQKVPKRALVRVDPLKKVLLRVSALLRVLKEVLKRVPPLKRGLKKLLKRVKR